MRWFSSRTKFYCLARLSQLIRSDFLRASSERRFLKTLVAAVKNAVLNLVVQIFMLITRGRIQAGEKRRLRTVVHCVRTATERRARLGENCSRAALKLFPPRRGF